MGPRRVARRVCWRAFGAEDSGSDLRLWRVCGPRRTTTLFTALNVLDGTVIGHKHQRKPKALYLDQDRTKSSPPSNEGTKRWISIH